MDLIPDKASSDGTRHTEKTLTTTTKSSYSFTNLLTCYVPSEPMKNQP